MNKKIENKKETKPLKAETAKVEKATKPLKTDTAKVEKVTGKVSTFKKKN